MTRLADFAMIIGQLRCCPVKQMGKYWGFIAVAVAAYGWFSGSLAPGALLILSLLAFFYCLFQAPVWCCAATREGGFCRRNASGILMGCSYRQHRWQKLKMFIRTSAWGALGKRLITGFHGAATSLSALGTLISAVVATAALFVGK
ncbi:hypothetical protein [Salinifilum ghardaiensis]